MLFVITLILQKIQNECNDLPEKIIGLGGEVVYSLDDSKCTHFIFTVSICYSKLHKFVSTMSKNLNITKVVLIKFVFKWSSISL